MIDREALASIRAAVELELASGVRDFTAEVPALPPLPRAVRAAGGRAKPAPAKATPPAPAPPRAPAPSPARAPVRAPAPAPSPAHAAAPSPASRPTPLPVLPTSEKGARLAAMAAVVKECTKCPLAKQRTQAVFARGDIASRIMFVGEGPGADEDRLGEPFVGRAGQLLDRIIEAMGLARDAVYIANVVKCRPPGNRVPTFEETAECFPYLVEQIDLVRPEILVALGATAARALLDTQGSMASLRGQVFEYRGYPLVCTYHPAYLLRNPADKGKVWEDMKLVMQRLGMPLPAPKAAAPASEHAPAPAPAPSPAPAPALAPRRQASPRPASTRPAPRPASRPVDDDDGAPLVPPPDYA